MDNDSRDKTGENIMKEVLRKSLVLGMSLVLCFLSVCSVSATGPIAKLIIFSTLEDNHSWIVIENLTNSKLRIGNYNIGGKRSVSLGT